ncbi:MAG: ATPase domain-containing protein [Bryobacteraceae bacterium]
MKLTGFQPLDTNAGGLGDTGSYLIRGPESGGKTSFCLGFVHRGLKAGEAVALVTNQSPPRVLDKARQLGFHLNEYLASRQLLIFEYPEQVEAAVAKVEDHSRIVDEFHGLLGNRKVERVVFDPVNPLVGADPGSRPSRFEQVVTSFGRLRACVAYVLEEAGDRHEIPIDSLHGVLTFRRGSGKVRRMDAELYSPAQTSHRFHFEIREGAGLIEAEEPLEEKVRGAKFSAPRPVAEASFPEEELEDDFGGTPFSAVETVAERVENPPLAQLHAHVGPERQRDPALRVRVTSNAAPPRAPSNNDEQGPRILLVESDASRRMNLRAQLERNFEVVEASGVHDALTLAAMANPAAILVAMEMPGVSGLELARMLREKGHNMLMVGMGDRTRHISERLAALAAGIDLCFAYSTDPRLLRLTLLNLMQRLSRIPGKQLAQQASRITRKQDDDSHRCTQDLGRFCGRIARETLYARENGLPFVIVAFRLPEVAEAVEQLAALAASLASVSDLVYAGPHGVACLLGETDSPQRFLAQLWEHWGGGFSPTIEELRYANQDAFLQRAREFVVTRAGAASSRKPVAIAAVAGAGGPGGEAFVERWRGRR